MAEPVVKLQSGSIRGVVEKHDEGFDYYAFRGVPYAEPPLGELRFKDPVPKKKWTGVIDCKCYGPMCLQYDFFANVTTTDEDCMYLNVFTRAINGTKSKKPVLVIIHGGAYIFGSGSDFYYGPDYLIRKDIVIVSFNYRVGVLGFLNLEDEVAPGNQGLKDQLMALQWVQQNIRLFGGDPKNVTICGMYIGASAAHYLAISPSAKGLFHKVISQSCCVYNPWIIISDPKLNAIKLCSILGKQLTDSKEILKFLTTVDTKNLQEAQERLRRSMDSLPFGPGIDNCAANPVVPGDREIAANEGVHLPYLIGYSARQGHILLLDSLNRYPRGELFQRYDQDFKNVFKYNTNQILDRYNLNAQQVRRLYYKSEKVLEDNIDKYVDFGSDFFFIEGIHKFARTQYERSSASTYMYVFDYDSPDSLTKAIIKSVPSGAGLGDDITHLFKMRLFKEVGLENWKKGTRAYRIMEQMTEMWANFVTHGRPTIEISELTPVHWKPINHGTLLRYLSIDEDVTMKYCVNLDRKFLSAKDIKA